MTFPSLRIFLASSLLPLVAAAQKPFPSLAERPASPSLSSPRSEASADAWSGLREAVDAERRRVRLARTGFVAGNPAQSWTTRFDGRGFLVMPSHGEWSWGLALDSYGYGTSLQSVADPRNTQADGSALRYDWGDSLTEWFENQAVGLEHGLDLATRPGKDTESDAPLVFTWTVRGDLHAEVLGDGRAVSFLNAEQEPCLTYSRLLVMDADGTVLGAHFLRDADRLLLSIDDAEARYPLHIDPTAQQAYIKASNTDPSDFFGAAVAMSGSTAVVGAFGESSAAVGVDGDSLDNSAGDAGAAYIFVQHGATWSQEAYLKASNTDPGDWFGGAVTIDGDTVVVSSMREDSAATGVGGDQTDNSMADAGAAYVFVRRGGAWHQDAYLKASSPSPGDFFGQSVSVSGNTVVVGATFEDSDARGINGNAANDLAKDSGAAYVFVRNGPRWFQQAYLKASNSDANDSFGFTVAIDGDTVLVGSPSEDSSATGVGGDQLDGGAPNSGAAYLFVRSGSAWTQQAYLKACNTEHNDTFGSSVALSRETAVVTAPKEDGASTGTAGDPSSNGAPDSGAAYVFVRRSPFWSQEAYLKASNTETSDQFGRSVAVAEDRIVVGTPLEASAATGVNGDPADNSASNAGAAYLFDRRGTTWTQQAYLKASNAEFFDGFGWALAITQETVFVGALAERSAATGINGNEDDNSASGAGAAYTFSLSPFLTPSETMRLGTPPNPAAFLPGRTQGPVVGGTWDPVMDHTSFAPTARLDLLIMDARLPINRVTPRGTLLCELPPMRQLFASAPGTPFAVRVPNDCTLIGISLCTQAGSVVPGRGILLANAIDIVIGSF